MGENLLSESEIMARSIDEGKDFYLVERNNKRMLVEFNDIKFKSDIIYLKSILTYHDGKLECKLKKYEIPFTFIKTVSVSNKDKSLSYYYLIETVSGKYTYNFPENKNNFDDIQEAYCYLDRYRRYYKEDRDYFLGLFCL